MAMLLDTQTKPEIDAANSRFFIETGLDILRSSMVSRVISIREGRNIRSPLLHDEIFELGKERKEFEEIVTAGRGIFRLAFSEKLNVNSKAYEPLVDEYEIEEGLHGLRAVEFVSSKRTAAKLTPGINNQETNYPLTLNLRIQTPSDVGPRVFDPDWTKGPDATRIVEQQSSGNWYSLPLEHIRIHLLEQGA